MPVRTYRAFTEKELEIISENQGEKNLKELSILLNINYTNLTGMLKQSRIIFKTAKSIKPTKVSFKVSTAMTKEVNEKKQKILTDSIMNSWFI